MRVARAASRTSRTGTVQEAGTLAATEPSTRLPSAPSMRCGLKKVRIGLKIAPLPPRR